MGLRKIWLFIGVYFILSIIGNGCILYYDFLAIQNQAASAIPFQFKIIGEVTLLVLLFIVVSVSEIASYGDRINNIRPIMEVELGTAAELIFDDDYLNSVNSNIMVRRFTFLQHKGWLTMAFTWKQYERRVRRIKWRYGEGCSGATWEDAETLFPSQRYLPNYSEASDPHYRDKWNMTKRQLRLTEDTNWVISTPLFNPKNHKFIGVLNFDGEKPLKRDNFDRDEHIEGQQVPDDEIKTEQAFSICVEYANRISSKLEEYGIV